jgi:hypothetical protein
MRASARTLTCEMVERVHFVSADPQIPSFYFCLKFLFFISSCDLKKRTTPSTEFKHRLGRSLWQSGRARPLRVRTAPGTPASAGAASLGCAVEGSQHLPACMYVFRVLGFEGFGVRTARDLLPALIRSGFSRVTWPI